MRFLFRSIATETRGEATVLARVFVSIAYVVQAQKHGAAAHDVAGDRLASAKAQAQDYAQAAQQRAAEHLDRVSTLSVKADNIGML